MYPYPESNPALCPDPELNEQSYVLQPAIQATDIHMAFNGDEILHGVDVELMPYTLTVIRGPSGSGKTTLLNILSGIERPTEGNVIHNSGSSTINLTELSQPDLTSWRAGRGYAFQAGGLLGGTTARRNILLPHKLTRQPVDKAWAGSICTMLGIENVLDQSAATLSGGQKLRVAFASALVHKPDILFADEPTAALDTAAKEQMHRIIHSLVKDMGVTVALVSHDEFPEDFADQVIHLQDGTRSAEQS